MENQQAGCSFCQVSDGAKGCLAARLCLQSVSIGQWCLPAQRKRSHNLPRTPSQKLQQNNTLSFPIQ
eukprot:1113218-Amphidinium_carterae.1